MAKRLIGNVKGPQGDPGETGARGSLWFSGTAITGTSKNPAHFNTVITVLQNDYYINTDTADVYQCSAGGESSEATWIWVTNLKGLKGDPGKSADIDPDKIEEMIRQFNEGVLKTSDKGVANGVASLDATGVIPNEQLGFDPSKCITMADETEEDPIDVPNDADLLGGKDLSYFASAEAMAKADSKMQEQINALNTNKISYGVSGTNIPSDINKASSLPSGVYFGNSRSMNLLSDVPAEFKNSCVMLVRSNTSDERTCLIINCDTRITNICIGKCYGSSSYTWFKIPLTKV